MLRKQFGERTSCREPMLAVSRWHSFLRVDSQSVEDSGSDVGWRDGGISYVGSVAIGGSVDVAAFDAGSRHQDREGVRPMLPAWS